MTLSCSLSTNSTADDRWGVSSSGQSGETLGDSSAPAQGACPGSLRGLRLSALDRVRSVCVCAEQTLPELPEPLPRWRCPQQTPSVPRFGVPQLSVFHLLSFTLSGRGKGISWRLLFAFSCLLKEGNPVSHIFGLRDVFFCEEPVQISCQYFY